MYPFILPLGVSKDGRMIYQVSPDANGFMLGVDDVEFLEDESAVLDLSNISLHSCNASSASATASASAGP